MTQHLNVCAILGERQRLNAGAFALVMLGGPSGVLDWNREASMRDQCCLSQLISRVFLLVIAAMAACSRGQQTGTGQHLYAAIPETAEIAVYPLAASGAAEFRLSRS